MKLYRKMTADHDGKPAVGDGRNMLGVRPADPANPKKIRDVVAAVGTDLVKPGKGMSVYNNPDEIPVHVSGVMWAIESDDLPAGLSPEQQGRRAAHHQIEPGWEMTLDEYQRLLESTRDLWEREPENPKP